MLFRSIQELLVPLLPIQFASQHLQHPLVSATHSDEQLFCDWVCLFIDFYGSGYKAAQNTTLRQEPDWFHFDDLMMGL